MVCVLHGHATARERVWLVPSGGLEKAGSLASTEPEVLSYSSADEGQQHQLVKAGKLLRGRSRDDDKSVGVTNLSGSPRPSRLALHRRSDPITRSFESLVGEPPVFPRQDKKLSPFLPSVVKSPIGT